MNQQICLIHGGNTYENHEAFLDDLRNKPIAYERLLYSPGWRDWLAKQLLGWDVVAPSMPNKQNASYAEWSLYFSKIIPYLRPSTILVGHSLGGIFLAKYLSENPPEKPYIKLVLLAAPYDDESSESLADFALSDVTGLRAAASQIHIMHSTDDPIVPYDEASKYLGDLPDAQLHTFTDKHHFIGQTFPELLEVATNGI